MQTTHTVLATPDVINRVTALDTRFARQVVKLLQFFASSYKEEFQFEAPPVHDPVAVAYVIAPHMFTAKLMRVDIETCSALSAGQTVCDTWGQSKARKNAVVTMAVDVSAVWEMMLDAIAQCSAKSPL